MAHTSDENVYANSVPFLHVPRQYSILTSDQIKFKKPKGAFYLKRCIQMTAVLLLILLLLSACGTSKKELTSVSRENFLMDTSINITLYDWENEDTLTKVMQEISRLEKLLSVEKEGSDLYRLEEAAGKNWVEISPECEEVLRLSKEVWKLSEGHFDVTTGPLIDLWNIRDGSGHYPSEEERQMAQAKVSSDQLLLEEGRAYLSQAGMKANLGAIAKGYIADCVKDLLTQEGVEHAIIDLGRNLLMIGDKVGEPYYVGVQSPFDDRGEIWKRLQITDQSVVTAGVNERFFEQDGVRYHHILDPFTGFPADTGVASVTIVSKKSVWGDALSTTCLLLGAEKGLALIESMPDTEALFIMQDQSEIMSSGFAAYVAE